LEQSGRGSNPLPREQFKPSRRAFQRFSIALCAFDSSVGEPPSASLRLLFDCGALIVDPRTWSPKLKAGRNSMSIIGLRPRRPMTLALIACATLACSAPAIVPTSTTELLVYHDPSNRFVFSYPASFGTTSIGTDNGFENRVAAIRFSIFSTGGLGGEAVLGQGRPSLDVQAAGGLYDTLVSGTLPAAVRNTLEAVLPPLTRDNLCDQIGREQHVDPDAPAFAALTAPQRAGLRALDVMGNSAPQVIRCTVSADTVTFDKEAAAAPGGVRRRVYGAVRFMETRYSTFQLIRAGSPVGDNVLDDIRQLVASWRAE
jgi:hypothetical protein